MTTRLNKYYYYYYYYYYFCSRWTSRVELSSGPAAQSRHHLRTVQATAEGTSFREAWTRRSVTSDMRRLRKTLTYLHACLLAATNHIPVSAQFQNCTTFPFLNCTHCHGWLEFTGLENDWQHRTVEIAKLDNDRPEFGGLENDGLSVIFQSCNVQSSYPNVISHHHTKNGKREFPFPM